MTQRTNDVLTGYEFIQERYCVTLAILHHHQKCTRKHKLTDASYARFVALANNSERYFLTILDNGLMGWCIRRKPVMCEHNNYICCPFGCDPNGLDIAKEEAINHAQPNPA